MITSTKLFLSAFAVVLLAQNVAAADEIFGSTFPAACTDTCASFEATVLKCSALTSTADLIACSCTADFQSQTQTCVQCIVTNAPGSDAATTAQTSAVGFAKNCQLPITLSSADAGAMSSLAVIDASLAAAAGGASSTASAAGSTTAAASSTSSAAASSSASTTSVAASSSTASVVSSSSSSAAAAATTSATSGSAKVGASMGAAIIASGAVLAAFF